MITPLGESLAVVTKQGIHRERGKMAHATTHTLQPLLCVVRDRSSVNVIAALDTIQPPIAILGAACTVLFAAAWFTADSQLARIMSLAPLCGLVVVARVRSDDIALSRSGGHRSILPGGLPLLP